MNPMHDSIPSRSISTSNISIPNQVVPGTSNSTKQRQNLSSRLDSLFSRSKDDSNTDEMRPTRAKPRYPSSLAHIRAHSSSPSLETHRKMTPSPTVSTQTLPVLNLNWLNNWSSTSPTKPSHGSESPRSHKSGPSTPSSPRPLPSPQLDLLREALEEDMPNRPVPAHLPPHFHPPRSFSRPPPFLDNLTRTTLPTSSLSQRPTSFYGNQHSKSIEDILPESPPIVLSHSPPTRSSVDTLRKFSFRANDDPLPSQPTGPGWRWLPDIIGNNEDSGFVSEPENDRTGLSKWWFQGNNKETADSLLSKEDRAATAEEEQGRIRRKYRRPKHPVVFCHGLLGFDTVTVGPSIAPVEFTYWRGLKEVLESNGIEVLITRVPATSSPIDRAHVLEKKISEVYPGRSVHLIGHSMGGLDCRYLTTHLTQRTFRVLSITTVATPHRGSSFADHFLATVGRERLPSVLSLLDLLPNGGGDGKAFESLTVDSMRKFNEVTPDVEGVHYFSWGASYEPGLIDTWKWSHGVILEKEGPNDGLVSVASAQWGKYLGTLTSVNHLDLVGWVNPARYKWASIMGREIKFHPATFYLGIADYLAGEVDGVPHDDDEADNVADRQDRRLGEGAEVESGEGHAQDPQASETLAHGNTSESPEDVKQGAEKLKAYQDTKNKGKQPVSVAHLDKDDITNTNT